MHLEKLFLINFRNYGEASVYFLPGTNIILGDNGEGKTNILEAIHLLSTSKSFRKASDQQLIQKGKRRYSITGEFSKNGVKGSLRIIYESGKKQLFINGNQQSKLSEIVGHLLTVVFSFDDLYLVVGPPQLRRMYMDLTLSTIDRIYLNNLREYLHTVRQKNRYLKATDTIDNRLLEVWNEKMVKSGAYIVVQRVKLVYFINQIIHELIKKKYTTSEDYEITYISTIDGVNKQPTVDDISEKFSKALFDNRSKEYTFKQSFIGPHRDDFSLTRRETKKNFLVRNFSSVGEARLIAILLKNAQALYFKAATGNTPIYLIDDIFLELDKENMEFTCTILDGPQQNIITSTEITRIPASIFPDRVLILKKGTITWKGTQSHQR